MNEPISKIEGARRQLDTAIDLYFDNADSLPTHTLAYAAFKVLFDLYPHHKSDGFAAQIDAMISKEGWRAMSGVAEHKRIRDEVRALPHEAKMVFARRQYHFVLENFDRLAQLAASAMDEGMTVTDMLDRHAERKG